MSGWRGHHASAEPARNTASFRRLVYRPVGGDSPGMGEGWARKDVKKVLDALTDIGHKELKKRGEFVLPGFAKFVVIKKPARPAREGINPFTKEPTVFAAKPASKVVKARPVKAIKDSIV